MNNFLVALITVTVGLGVMIFLHEWGHFIAAKLCGVRVDVFSLGFGTRLWGFKRGDTDYRLSALPFGGYVRMAGDNPLEERTGAAYEFLSQPRWKRFLIAVAGPFMNILLTFVLFWGIFWFAGVPTPGYLRQSPVVAALPQYAPVMPGLAAGDRIVSVNGLATSSWNKANEAAAKIAPGGKITLVISRKGAEQTLTATLAQKSDLFTLLGYPMVAPVIDEVAIGFPADRAGLKSGDLFVAVDGKPVITWPQLVDAVHHSAGAPINFTVRRADKDIPIAVTPTKGMDPTDGQMVWQVGVQPKTKDDFENQSFTESVADAGISTVNGTQQIMDVLGGLLTGKVSVRQLQGVVGIARESGRAAKRGPMDLITLMAVLSLNLGILNLLPIPILDGGHVLLLAVEGLLRRDLSIAVKERFVQVGLVFLLGIFAFVMYSDILKIFQSHH